MARTVNVETNAQSPSLPWEGFTAPSIKTAVQHFITRMANRAFYLSSTSGALKLCWGQTGKTICIVGGGDTLEIDVWDVDISFPPEGLTVSHRTHFRTGVPHIHAEAFQVIFCDLTSQLMLVVPGSVEIYALDGMPRRTPAHLRGLKDSLWMIHPQHQHHLLEVASDSIVVCDWMLSELQRKAIDLPFRFGGFLSEAVSSVDHATLLPKYHDIVHPYMKYHALMELPAFTVEPEPTTISHSTAYRPPPSTPLWLSANIT